MCGHLPGRSGLLRWGVMMCIKKKKVNRKGLGGMTGPIHHGRGAASWPRLIPARGLRSCPAAPSTQPLSGSRWCFGGGFVSRLCSPRSLAIRHPAGGMAAGFWVKGRGAARLGGGRGRAAGAEDPAVAAGHRWGRTAGGPAAKRVLHPTAVPEQRRARGAVPQRVGASRASRMAAGALHPTGVTKGRARVSPGLSQP